MRGLPPPPQGPDWRVDWAALAQACPWLTLLERELAACPQDPIYHAEGDVLVHTRAVCECLVELPAWQTLPPDERRVVFAAALLHDAGKPLCTRALPDGRLTTAGHASRGAIVARRLLWEAGTPFGAREAVAALVRFHQLPFVFLDRDDPRRQAIGASQSARCDHLSILAEADALGRRCHPADQRRMLEHAAYFAELCAELGCLQSPRPFPTTHARFRYFRHQGDDPDPDFAPFDPSRCEAVVMCGLPGAGKDHWVRQHLPDHPVVSLDAIRQARGVRPRGDQRGVVAQARAAARALLRARRPLVWNATNLSRRLRRECVDYLATHGARIRLVYVEVPQATLRRQNRGRPDAVPEGAMERLLRRWEVPDLTEAHHLDLAIS